MRVVEPALCGDKMIKYAIHPGWVKSEFDGDFHYVTYAQLIRLCHVNPNECVRVEHDEFRKRGMCNLGELRHFYPSRDGLYNRDGR